VSSSGCGSGAVLDDRPCGCELPPVDCPVWGPAIDLAVERLGCGDLRGTAQRIVAAQREVGNTANIPRVLASAGAGVSDWPALRLLQEATEAICDAVAEVTGRRTLVDTSKRPIDAAVVAGVAGIDHYVLHIVRDPRAVAYSWTRVKTFTASGTTRTMGRQTARATARRWVTNAGGAELLRRHTRPERWRHLRYEDFAAEPRPRVDDVLSFLSHDGTAPFIDSRTVQLSTNHIVSGNPSRFTTGRVTIRPDDEWRREMPRAKQLGVASATFPLMVRYGYLGRRARR
jgi:Sulfotransferase family